LAVLASLDLISARITARAPASREIPPDKNPPPVTPEKVANRPVMGIM